MVSDLTPRAKWQLLVSGEDPGPMVCPVCDDWSLDIPYRWPYEGSDPFPPGHRWHALSQQMAMARVCGWDPTFYAAVDYHPRRQEAEMRSASATIDGALRTEYRIATPLGDLTSVSESKTTSRTVKHWLETEQDFRKMTWVARAMVDHDEESVIRQGEELLRAVGQRGVLGTWFGPPIGYNLNRDMMFYHLLDWPDAFEELHQATVALEMRQIETLRKAGFDYLFYCVDATEWISPEFFRTWILEDTRRLFARWRELGGFILWHSCGRIAKFVELGFYNDLAPNVFETLSEPPVGDLPGLRWAREHLHARIATRGNIGLDVMLQGTEDDVRRAVQRVRSQTAGYRHVVGLSDDILKNTPLSNAKALVEEARRPLA